MQKIYKSLGWERPYSANGGDSDDTEPFDDTDEADLAAREAEYWTAVAYMGIAVIVNLFAIGGAGLAFISSLEGERYMGGLLLYLAGMNGMYFVLQAVEQWNAAKTSETDLEEVPDADLETFRGQYSEDE